MTPKTIVTRDPMQLRPHRLLKLVPGWAEDDERFYALVEDVKERGIDHALLVTADGQILEGRERWKAAKRLQFGSVPCFEREESEAAGIILNNLVQRKHFTKGALAYVAFPLLAPAVEESKERRAKYLKSGEKPSNSRKSIESTYGAVSAEEMAAKLGFGRDQFFYAKRLHEVFAESDKRVAEYGAAHPGWKANDEQDSGLLVGPWDLRARFEPQILAGEIGLGAALAGIAGLLETKGKDRNDYGQLELFTKGLETLAHRFDYWAHFDEAQRAKARLVLRQTVATMPEDLREEMVKAIRLAEKEEKAA